MTNLIQSAIAQLKELILDAVGRLVAAEKIPAVPMPGFNIEVPSDRQHGDFASNVAMVCAKAFRNSPLKIAEMITSEINLGGSFFGKTEIAGPGFMNFFLSSQWFSDTVVSTLKEGGNYGKTSMGDGKRVLIEFVSANPTGPMHIGNARGGAIGDTLASIMNWAGFHAEREFYINDAGNQIEKFGKSLSLRYMQICSSEGQQIISENSSLDDVCRLIFEDSSEGGRFEMPDDVYLGADIIEHAKNYYDTYGDTLVNVSENERKNTLSDFALPKNIAALERDLKKYRIVYDTWYKESMLHENGETLRIVEKLKESGHTYEQDGAIWFKAVDFGVDKDFVLVRANGIPTYIVPDIAYHYDKLVTRNFDKAINVLGADHHGYAPRLKAALSALGINSDKLDVILMQMVRLLRNGEVAKLSKRSGKSITLVTLLEEIPIDAARFFFNMREANSQFEFDLDLAVEKSSQNPVYYVQYAHARICSLLENLKADGDEPNINADLSLLSHPSERELIRHIATLPDEINLAAKTYDPSKITKYAITLATLYHSFYDKCPVKKAETQELKIARLTLCLAAKQALSNTLSILNIDCPNKM